MNEDHRNHLPAELAAQILGRESRLTAADLMTAAEREVGLVLGEEHLEVALAASKLGRFGFSVNPHDGKHSREKLAEECGHALATMMLAEAHGLVTIAEIEAACDRKLRDYVVGPRCVLRHAGLTEERVAEIVAAFEVGK